MLKIDDELLKQKKSSLISNEDFIRFSKK